MSSSIPKGVPIRVLENIKRMYNIRDQLKDNIRDQMKENNGSFCAIYLDQLDLIDKKPEMCIENVLKNLTEINERPAKIVHTGKV
jgi:hypothetical protein